jgi:sugar lactone lactonase YvrE
MGNGKEGWNGDGHVPTETKLQWPKGVAIGHDNDGDILYVTDCGNNRIRAMRLATKISWNPSSAKLCFHNRER